MTSPSQARLNLVLSGSALDELVPDERELSVRAEEEREASIMSMRVDRFREWLDAETYVNVAKIRKEALHGVPTEVRADVWMYLLSVLRAERSDELSLQRNMQSEYKERVEQIHDDDDVARHVRGAVNRLRRKEENRMRMAGDDDSMPPHINVQVYVRLISIYLNAPSRSITYHPAMIPLVSPFVYVYSIENEAYYCFYALMQRHENMFSPDGLNRAVANFSTLLRVLEPLLTEHFETEEVEPNAWVPAWLQTLLAGQLRRSCVLRLWDTYFSANEGLQLHVYVCLAVINWVREDLLEQDGPEISGYLLNLPTLDMDQIIARRVDPSTSRSREHGFYRQWRTEQQFVTDMAIPEWF